MINAKQGDAVPILTHVYVNVARRATGFITAQSHPTKDLAIFHANAMSSAASGTKCIARLRVQIECVDGQFDF